MDASILKGVAEFASHTQNKSVSRFNRFFKLGKEGLTAKWLLNELNDIIAAKAACNDTIPDR